MVHFAAEYCGLVSRYHLLRCGPSADAGEVGIRCYAFPMPLPLAYDEQERQPVVADAPMITLALIGKSGR